MSTASTSLRLGSRRRLLRLMSGLAGLAALAGCAPAAATLGGLFIPRDGLRVDQGLAYGPEARHRLDVYRPEAIEASAKVVIFFYGGSWRSGERGYYHFVGEALASSGVIVVVPDYRVYPEARFPAFVEDAARAVRWVADNIAGFGGDERRLFLMGHSAGAHIAALLVVDPAFLAAAGVPADAIAGLIGLAGPYAFDPTAYRSTRAVFAGLADVRRAQPAALVAAAGPPVLLLHGLDDRVVRPDNSRALAAGLRAQGGVVEVVEYAETGHIDLVVALGHPFRRPGGIRDRIADFIDRH